MCSDWRTERAAAASLSLNMGLIGFFFAKPSGPWLTAPFCDLDKCFRCGQPQVMSLVAAFGSNDLNIVAQ